MNRGPLIGALAIGAAIMALSKTTGGGSGGGAPKLRARHYRAGRASGAPIWVVIHTAEIDERTDAAEALEKYAATTTHAVSWHYAVDADSTTQSVGENDTAFACGPGNARSVNVELAGRASQDASAWDDPYSRAVLARAANLVRGICERWKIPIERIGRDEVLAMRSGITGHSDISDASQYAKAHEIRSAPWYDGTSYRTTNHRDPGAGFPWARFLEMVRGNA